MSHLKAKLTAFGRCDFGSASCRARLAGEIIRRTVAIKVRTLGRNGLQVSALGLGCLSLTGDYGTPVPESVAKALELGITFLDTADAYSANANELLVGRAIRGHRNEVVLATKFGLVNGAVGSDMFRADAAYVRSACDASLGRLGVDHIDLYYCHRVDPRVPVEETVGAMGDLVRAGKVRYLGLSEVTAETLRRAHATHPIMAIESEWSIWSRGIEGEVLPVARSLGTGIVAYAPLGRGFLTGKITEELPAFDRRQQYPRFQRDNFGRNRAWVVRLDELARRKGCSTAQLALAWLSAQGEDVVPIPGADRPEYVEENVHALDIDLTRDDLDQIEKLAAPGAVSGDRYANMGFVAGETPPKSTDTNPPA